MNLKLVAGSSTFMQEVRQLAVLYGRIIGRHGGTVDGEYGQTLRAHHEKGSTSTPSRQSIECP